MIDAQTLTLREISHRRGNFLLGALAVGVAVTSFAATLVRLRAFDAATEDQLREFDQRTAAEMATLEDEIRRSMKGLGFNIFIFPAGQDLDEVYAEGYASKTMPEAYVERLAASEVVKINHLLPSLTQKVMWPEQRRTILLIGTRGEVPIGEGPVKKPLIDPVAAGRAVLGYELHHSLGLRPGDGITLMGQTFTIDRPHSQRGSADDITIWLNLAEAQQLLSKPEEINAILALECNCASVDRIAEVRAEIQNILPDTVVIEKESTALARAEARNTAKRNRGAGTRADAAEPPVEQSLKGEPRRPAGPADRADERCRHRAPHTAQRPAAANRDRHAARDRHRLAHDPRHLHHARHAVRRPRGRHRGDRHPRDRAASRLDHLG